MAAYEEAARRIPVGEGAQVIVAGGGAGGIAAALLQNFRGDLGDDDGLVPLFLLFALNGAVFSVGWRQVAPPPSS